MQEFFAINLPQAQMDQFNSGKVYWQCMTIKSLSSYVTHLYHGLSHMQYIFRRGKWFHFKHRIPNLYRDFYDHDVIQVSLKTDSEFIAQQRASILNNELEKIWHQVATGAQEKSDDQFQQAVLIARLGGFTYRPVAEIAKEDIGNIVSRVEAVKNDVEKPRTVLKPSLAAMKSQACP